MLTLKYIQENTQEVIDRLAVKRFDAKATIEKILIKDEERKSTQKEQDDILALINTNSKEVGQLYKEGKVKEADAAKDKTTALKEIERGCKRAYPKVVGVRRRPSKIFGSFT